MPDISAVAGGLPRLRAEIKARAVLAVADFFKLLFDPRLKLKSLALGKVIVYRVLKLDIPAFTSSGMYSIMQRSREL